MDESGMEKIKSKFSKDDWDKMGGYEKVVRHRISNIEKNIEDCKDGNIILCSEDLVNDMEDVIKTLKMDLNNEIGKRHHKKVYLSMEKEEGISKLFE